MSVPSGGRTIKYICDKLKLANIVGLINISVRIEVWYVGIMSVSLHTLQYSQSIRFFFFFFLGQVKSLIPPQDTAVFSAVSSLYGEKRQCISARLTGLHDVVKKGCRDLFLTYIAIAI